jgi:hypothetical protein
MKVVLPNISANRRSTLCLAYKRKIIQESAEVDNIKKTAWKYGVQPQQIRQWKCAFDHAMTNACDVSLFPRNISIKVSQRFIVDCNQPSVTDFSLEVDQLCSLQSFLVI